MLFIFLSMLCTGAMTSLVIDWIEDDDDKQSNTPKNTSDPEPEPTPEPEPEPISPGDPEPTPEPYYSETPIQLTLDQDDDVSGLSDTFYGSHGDDVIAFDTPDPMNIIDTIKLGDGDDQLEAMIDDDYPNYSGPINIHGEDGEDTINIVGNFYWETNVSVYGGEGNDSLSGGNDFIDSTRVLQLFGGEGDDTIEVWEGRAYGGEGDDVLIATASNAQNYGGDGDDVFYGHPIIDNTFPEGRDSRNYGGDGDDTFFIERDAGVTRNEDLSNDYEPGVIYAPYQDSYYGGDGADTFLLDLDENFKAEDDPDDPWKGGDTHNILRLTDFESGEDKLIIDLDQMPKSVYFEPDVNGAMTLKVEYDADAFYTEKAIATITFDDPNVNPDDIALTLEGAPLNLEIATA